jgi:hypothetical protein
MLSQAMAKRTEFQPIYHATLNSGDPEPYTRMRRVCRLLHRARGRAGDQCR